MKIRTDFVTNSSSSSFIVYSYEIYDCNDNYMATFREYNFSESEYFMPNDFAEAAGVGYEAEKFTEKYRVEDYKDYSGHDPEALKWQQEIKDKVDAYFHEQVLARNSISNFLRTFYFKKPLERDCCIYYAQNITCTRKLDSEFIEELGKYPFKMAVVVSDIISIDYHEDPEDPENPLFDPSPSLEEPGEFYVIKTYQLDTRYVVPDGTVEIKNREFAKINTYLEIVIPDSVRKIGKSAFSVCVFLKNITIPEGVTEIGESAFKGCEFLTSITIPESVTKIGDGAFNGCKSLTTIIIPESVTEIRESTFKGCSNLTNISIPESVIKIGKSAFSGCVFLKNITIPEGVTEIGESAFYSCSNLTNISIPESVIKIGKKAFNYCECLNDITILSKDVEITEKMTRKKVVIHGYPNSTAEAYAKKNGNPFIPIEA